jgi:hypothetical protein
MANQQVLFAETIAGMKKAFKRKAYESDSDSEIENYGNRGHKLKKRARFSHRGQLVPSEGPSAYKQSVDYAGVRRSIIYRNPPLFDEDGYEVDSGDDEDRIEEAVATAAELNPYSNIRLENILAPLTASTDLPSHPTLSKPFISHNLSNLALQSSQMMRRENMSLWQVRHLWTSLCGDHVWVPCKTMLGSNDIELYTDDHVAKYLLALSKGSAIGTGGHPSPAIVNGEDQGGRTDGVNKALASKYRTQNEADVDVNMEDANTAQAQSTVRADDRKTAEQDANAASSSNPDANLANENLDGPDMIGGMAQEDGITQDNKNNQLELAAPSVASEGTDQAFVHPMFLPPENSRADRDVGLPEQEAEDLRRLLALYVSKQEEVCRGVKKLHDGLYKAHRLRHDVLRWSKAEAHSGLNRDMSDGEDWYDKEEWGLTEDLKKGQDDEEEDTTTTGKKTRARR